MRKIWDFHGGVHPPENKHQSLGRPIRSAGIPPELTLPLNQHIGAPAEPIVTVGQKVLKGECIAKAAGLISVPVHAPTSGTITAIEERLVAHPSGLPTECIILETDGEDRWIERTGIADPATADKATLLACIRDAGIAGMGGAGFPTSVKLGVNPRGGGIDTLVLNGTECEPYITADHVLMRERADEIVAGARILQQLVEPKETLLGVEDNKPDAIEALRQACQGEDMEVVVFPTKYPSGGEKQLIEILTGRQVPSGGLPADIGVVCQNMGTAVAVYRAVVHGEPLISRITTVTGEAVAQPGNFEVLLGTPMSYLLELSGFSADRLQRLVMGGPMMGFTVPDPAVPIVKTTNCILAPTTSELPPPPPAQPCIRCGLCAEACPASLLPQQLYWFSRGKEYEKLEAHNLFDCIECGACSFACPSNIPLVQYYRASKAEITQLKRDQAKSEHSKTRFEARQERLQREAEAKEAQRAARKQAAEARAREAAEAGGAEQDPIQAAIERAKARKAAAQDGEKTSQRPAIAQLDPAELAIERARAARAASADQSPEDKARANLARLQERLAKSEAKLAASRESGAEANIIEALEAAIEKLQPKLEEARRQVEALPGEPAPAAEKDAAQLAIERAQAARAASANQDPGEKARANLERLQERLAKSEAKLAASRESGADDTIIEALEAAIDKLKPKLEEAQREVDALHSGQEA
ncbi:MAG: electron transport complex subunit RsxC [Halieaceae bacterium]|jgi:electron transport complex protein RnfC|nr:electron transport complex subunit RsxC [Halieaceae bacterium]